MRCFDPCVSVATCVWGRVHKPWWAVRALVDCVGPLRARTKPQPLLWLSCSFSDRAVPAAPRPRALRQQNRGQRPCWSLTPNRCVPTPSLPTQPYVQAVPSSCTRPHAQTHTCTQMQTFTYFLHEPHTQAHVGTHTHCAHKPKAPHSVHTLMPTPVCRGRYGNTVSRMAGPAPQDPGVPQHPDPFPAIALQPRPRSAF